MAVEMVSWFRAECNSCKLKSVPVAVSYCWEDEPWKDLDEEQMSSFYAIGWEVKPNADAWCSTCKTAVR